MKYYVIYDSKSNYNNFLNHFALYFWTCFDMFIQQVCHTCYNIIMLHNTTMYFYKINDFNICTKTGEKLLIHRPAISFCNYSS